MSIRGALFGFLLLASAGAAARAEELLYYSQCTIYSDKLAALWKFPGSLCAFLGDGRFFAQTPRTFGLFDRRQRPVWEKELHAHHQLILLAHGRGAAVIRSATIEVAGKKVRTDAITAFSPEGKTLAELTLDRKSGFTLPKPGPFLWCPTCYPGVTQEVSHVNSLRELPVTSSKLAAFHEGNFLFNDIMTSTIFVADAGLKKVLWSLPYRSMGFGMLHDVQLLENGNLAFFLNRRRDGEARSSVVELDPASRKVVKEYRGDEPFFAEIQGSLQVLGGGRYLLSYRSHGSTVGRLVGADGKTERELPLGALFPQPVQSVYEAPLRPFLDSAQP